MSDTNRIIWSEGMFLRPQHFQQQTRHVESYVERRFAALGGEGWGFSEIKLDQQLLGMGKLGISSARGVFPDGTPLHIPEDDEPPPVIDVPADCRDSILYLGLPLRRAGGVEVGEAGDSETLARYSSQEFEARDAVSGNGSVAPLQVGSLRTRLLLETDKRDEYACLAIARIIELRTDNRVILDERFIPNVSDCQAAEVLAGFLKELEGLLHHRGEALAGRVVESGRGGAAEIAQFMMLQVVNRYEPVIAHLARIRGVHPELLYRYALEITGELTTFTESSKRPPAFDSYHHDDLTTSFDPLMRALRQALSEVIDQSATSLPLQERKFGIRVSPIADRKLLLQANFVLAVSADIPVEDLRRRFPTLVKIGPVEKIRELVNLALPGIKVTPLPVAPRQIPYHSGFVYFELDRSGEYWRQLQSSGGFAIHLSGDFPGVKMEFWAIKS